MTPMRRPGFALIPGLIFFCLLLPGRLVAQTEYAVIIREAGTKKTYFGNGGTSKETHTSRLFGVAKINFADSFARGIEFRGVLHARKVGKQFFFAPRPLADEDEWHGTSYLVNGGPRTGILDMQALMAQDPQRPVWLFPQGKAGPVQLVNSGSFRQLATRSVSRFAFGCDIGENVAINATGTILTLDPALSRELNALSPTGLIDAGTKLISLLTAKGWINAGENAF